jgi:SAM-dependent methyltransferase
MQERHLKREIYFEEQAYTTATYVIPFISGCLEIRPGTKVLEIGCGEGGNLRPFLEAGCEVTGVDILAEKIKNAENFFRGHPYKNSLKLIAGDIYDVGEELSEQFDLVYMRDVIEHIHNQERFLAFAGKFLKPGGKFYLGFPPWQNPFGGHQQVCRSKFLSKLPYFHLLPGPLYPWMLKLFHEPDGLITDLLEIRDTAISIERFRRIINKENYTIDKEVFYLFNPNYEIKFGLKPRRQISLISGIPWLRNFLITSCYYLLCKQLTGNGETKNGSQFEK